MILVILHKNLFKNKELKNIMPKSHLETNVCYIHLNLVFLSLFGPLNYLLSLFIAKQAISEFLLVNMSKM